MKVWCLGLIGLLFSGNCLAELFVHQLRYQNATEVEALIRPHLSANATLSSKDYTLLIQSSLAEYEKLKAIIETIDRKPAELLVEVLFSDQQLQDSQGYSTRARITNEQAQVRVRTYATASNDMDTRSQKVRVTEGYEGFIHTGEEFPYTTFFPGYEYDYSETTTEYKPVLTGFYFLARIAGDDRVNLMLSAQSQKRTSTRSTPDINLQAVSTHISGAIGEWILVGGNNTSLKLEQRGYYSSRELGQKAQWVYLRVSKLVD